MNIKRIISLILCIITVLSFAVTHIGAEGTGNIDIPDKWYKEPLEYCLEKGYMVGPFSPDDKLTRAVFITVLAAVSGDDISVYKSGAKPDFADVVEGRWYVPFVAWATDKGIAAGYGSKFGVDDALTREQMAVMLCAFAKYKGIDTENAKDSALNKFGDADKISSWARKAVKFASSFGLVNGTGTLNGAPLFSPKGTSTRAQCAVIIRNFDNTNFDTAKPIANLTLNGNPISNYKIVYGTTYEKKLSKNHAGAIANRLAEYLKKATGVELSVSKDTETPKGEYEILIGKTNREVDGTVTVDRTKLGKRDTGYIAMQGNYLVIASDEEKKGTYYSMYSFLEKCLGYYVYGQGVEFIAPKKELDIKDGLEIIDEPYMELRTSLQYGTGEEVQREGDSVTFGNMVHTLRALSQDDFEPTDDFHLKYYLSDDPCLTDTKNIDNIIASVKILLNKEKDCNRIWVCQSDTESYCKCANCSKVYRTFGKAATYVQIMQYVADAIKDEYPNVKIVSLAYKFTHSNFKTDISDSDYSTFLESFGARKYIPSKNLECPDNVICCLCTDNACSAHPIGDENCKNLSNNSVTLAKQLDILNKIYKHIYVWYYVDGDDMNYPCPNFDVIYENYQYFVNHKIEGMYIQGTTYKYCDFALLRTYLTGRLSWYSTMTREEYTELVNGYLCAYYGEGWTYVREYLDTLTALMQNGNEWHVWSKGGWNQRISEAQYRENIDYLRSLWDKALALCDTQAQREHILETKVEIDNVAYKLGEAK